LEKVAFLFCTVDVWIRTGEVGSQFCQEQN